MKSTDKKALIQFSNDISINQSLSDYSKISKDEYFETLLKIVLKLKLKFN